MVARAHPLSSIKYHLVLSRHHYYHYTSIDITAPQPSTGARAYSSSNKSHGHATSIFTMRQLPLPPTFTAHLVHAGAVLNQQRAPSRLHHYYHAPAANKAALCTSQRHRPPRAYRRTPLSAAELPCHRHHHHVLPAVSTASSTLHSATTRQGCIGALFV